MNNIPPTAFTSSTSATAQRAQELDARSVAQKATKRQGVDIYTKASARQDASNATTLISALVTIPVFAIFPPAGVLTVGAALAGAEQAESSEKAKELGKQMVAYSAYRFNMSDFDALFAGDERAATVARILLRGRNVIKTFPTAKGSKQDDMHVVLPKTRISDILKQECFDVVDLWRPVLKHFLQKVQELAPVVEACDEAERQLQAAITKRDNEKAKLYSEQLLTLRKCWASDGKQTIVHDADFEAKADHRMLTDLRRQLAAERERGGLRDVFKIRKLEASIKDFERLVAQQATMREDLIDLQDAPALI